MLSWITVSRGYPSTSAARLITSSPFSGKMATCRDQKMHWPHWCDRIGCNLKQSAVQLVSRRCECTAVTCPAYNTEGP